jgi:prevent-host-death family protein
MNVKEARGSFSDVLNRVAAGDEVVITRRGDDIARIVPAKRARRKPFPSHKALRDSITLKGEPMSKTITRLRNEERY